eukprot:gb/GECG01008089.1/.p1 GENE.gb/GECG01008089.1/~~gb/GECG01008089.1/.p1  ORF type:complete len:416 (+),score=54.72 gb/GECG01008089.1/:1-1248(+)
MSQNLRGSATEYDYIVIGGGSGGVASAKRAAGYDKKVLVVERSRMGGTCVNVGCVPKKVMFNASTVCELLHECHHFGYEGSELPKLNWGKLKEHRDHYVSRLNKIYENGLDKLGITVVQGTASFVDKNTVEVDGQKYTAPHILIAVGGAPKWPDIPGNEHVITSDGFFELEELPKKAVVVGSGYIGVELAGMLASMGTEVTMFARSRLLRGFDELAREHVKKSYREKLGMIIVEGTIPKEIVKSSDGTLTAKAELNGEDNTVSGNDVVLYAIGRAPMTKQLKLENAGVEVKPSGHIPVDKETSETNVDSVYALGDVIGVADLTPVAIAAGRMLSDNLFGPPRLQNAKMNYSLIPTVVFSHPPIASCGLTEDEARKRYGDSPLKIYKSTFVNLWYGPYQVCRRRKHFFLDAICLVC